MSKARKVILSMETAVNETAELAAALRLCAVAAEYDGVDDLDCAGIRHIAGLVAERASLVLERWNALDAATSPPREVDHA